MGNENITKKQCIAIMGAFLMGSSMVIGVGSEARKDAWIAVLIAILLSLPVVAIYGRIISIFPGKCLYEILFLVFGKVIGIIVAISFIWYAFHLGAMVIRNFTEFIMIVSLPETPQFVIAIFLMLLAVWAVKAGVEVVGRWTAIIFPIMVTAIIMVTFFMIPRFDFNNIKPILDKGIKPVMDAAFTVFSFPFAETVLFIVLFGNLKKNINPYKIYYWGLFIGGAIILLVTVRSIISLGIPNTSIMYFASFASVRLINIGDFLQRIEVSVAVVFLSGGFVKICVCLYAVSKGIAEVLKINNYRDIVAPVGVLMMILSIIIYRSTMEMFEWAEKVYKYYSIPFEIILPLIIWIAAEIKSRRLKNKSLQCDNN